MCCLFAVQLRELEPVVLASAQRLLPGTAPLLHRFPHARLGGLRAGGQRLHRDEVRGGFAPLHGDLVLGLLDLLLADLEQDLRGPEVVVRAGLVADDDVLHLLLPGELLGRLRLEEGGDGHQLRAAALVQVVDGVDHDLALRIQVPAAVHQVGLGLGEPVLRGRELDLHRLVADPGRDQLDAHLLQLRDRGVEVSLGRLQTRGRLAVLAARLVQLVSSVLELLLDVLLTVVEVACVGHGGGHHADRQGTSRGCGCPATAGGTGEETHRVCLRRSGK